MQKIMLEGLYDAGRISIMVVAISFGWRGNVVLEQRTIGGPRGSGVVCIST